MIVVDHFRRAKAMFAAIAAAMALPTASLQRSALDKIEPYRSRGKGRGTPSKRYGNRSGKYTPHQGKKEIAKWKARFAAGTHGHMDHA